MTTEEIENLLQDAQCDSEEIREGLAASGLLYDLYNM